MPHRIQGGILAMDMHVLIKNAQKQLQIELTVPCFFGLFYIESKIPPQSPLFGVGLQIYIVNSSYILVIALDLWIFNFILHVYLTIEK